MTFPFTSFHLCMVTDSHRAGASLLNISVSLSRTYTLKQLSTPCDTQCTVFLFVLEGKKNIYTVPMTHHLAELLVMRFKTNPQLQHGNELSFMPMTNFFLSFSFFFARWRQVFFFLMYILLFSRKYGCVWKCKHFQISHSFQSFLNVHCFHSYPRVLTTFCKCITVIKQYCRYILMTVCCKK